MVNPPIFGNTHVLLGHTFVVNFAHRSFTFRSELRRRYQAGGKQTISEGGDKKNRPVLFLPCDLGGAIRVARDDGAFPFLNEERFRTPESSKSQGSYCNVLVVPVAGDKDDQLSASQLRARHGVQNGTAGSGGDGGMWLGWQMQ